MKIAIRTPVTNEPASIPPTASVPRRIPTTRGQITAIAPGIIISRSEAVVAIATHDL